MRAFREEDFRKMSRDVVSGYLKKEASLSDGLVKVSEDMGLDPNQIQNLVQLANSLAHLTLFENKNDGDKIINFSPADPDDVLRKVYKENPVPESQEGCECDAVSPMDRESDFFGDFPNLAEKLKSVLSSGGETTEIVPGGMDDPGGNARSMMVIKIRKVASELKDKELSSAMEYQEELDKLASDFAKLYGPDYNEFEKTAFALRGEMAVPILTDIRACLRISGAVEKTAFEKTACVVDTDTKEIKSLDKLIKLAESHRDYAKAYNYLQQEVGGVL